MRRESDWRGCLRLRNAAVVRGEGAAKAAQMLPCERFRAPGSLRRARRSDGQARAEQLCLVCVSVLGASWEPRAHADENFCDALETAWILLLIVESGVAAMSDGCGAMSPKLDSCDARALVSLVGKAQKGTILWRAQDGDSFWILSVAEGRVSLRDHGEWFATCAWGGVGAGVYSDEVVD
jgi:hypothetical protein